MRFANILVVTCWAVFAYAAQQVKAATITAEAGCDISSSTLDGSTAASCATTSGPIEGGVLNTNASVSVGTLMQASYALRVADYGHLGAAVQTYAEGNNGPFGSYRSADAYAYLGFSDVISISSVTLAFGSPVPVKMTLKVDGDMGINNGDPIYYQQQAWAYARGDVTLDFGDGSIPTYTGNYCVYSASVQNCAVGPQGISTFSGINEQTVFLLVGYNYRLSTQLTLQAHTFVDLAQSCPDNFCDAGAYVDSSHSLFNYVTPLGSDFQITSESGHDYSISAVAEPSVSSLFVAGLCILGAITRRNIANGMSNPSEA